MLVQHNSCISLSDSRRMLVQHYNYTLWHCAIQFRIRLQLILMEFISYYHNLFSVSLQNHRMICNANHFVMQ